MVLCQHDRDFSIALDGQEVMTSREYESELELARLGCDRIKERPRAKVLIGGLGLGYTLRQTLDLLGPQARVVVAELLPELVKWNRDILGHLAGHPLRDERVVVKSHDVRQVIRESPATFDAIMLDVDNGPNAMTHSGNAQLYNAKGIQQSMRALRPGGCLAIWSVTVDVAFEKRLRQQGLCVRHFRVRAYKASKSRSRVVWVATRDRQSLPYREDAEPKRGRPRPRRTK